MHDANSHSFITPTTCFTIACVAFSLVAISTIWKNQASTKLQPETSSNQHNQSRPQPQRRLAVDSLYPETRDVVDAPSKQTRLTELISQSARVAQLLQGFQDSLAIDLLSEVAHITTALCRLQQELIMNPAAFSNANGPIACFDAVVSALQAVFASLEASLRSGRPGSAMSQSMQQLRDQRPILDFLLSSSNEPSLPPTPPAEAETAAAMKEPLHQGLGLGPPVSFEPHTGITPSLDEKCWIEPPPEYSPPAGSRSPVLLEKSDPAMETVQPEIKSPEREDSPEDGDALYEAVTNNDTEFLADLLSDGADPASHFGELQRTPLHQAAHLNHCACILILLRYSAVMSTEDAKGDTAVHLAAWAGNVEALSTLLAHGADLDWLSGRDGYSPLWCAVTACQIDAARLLLKSGARVNLRSASGGGLTPLHQAAVTGQSAMCELLLERGALPDCLDDDKNTPLHYAAASGSVASVKVLLRSGADMEAQQSNGLTAVHWAAHKGHTEVLATLLDYGASLDQETEEGATPLHLAANRGHLPTCRLLLERGASKTASHASWDGAEGTPAQMAKAKGHLRLAQVLKA